MEKEGHRAKWICSLSNNSGSKLYMWFLGASSCCFELCSFELHIGLVSGAHFPLWLLGPLFSSVVRAPSNGMVSFLTNPAMVSFQSPLV